MTLQTTSEINILHHHTCIKEGHMSGPSNWFAPLSLFLPTLTSESVHSFDDFSPLNLIKE
jgi:hypothetical protein